MAPHRGHVAVFGAPQAGTSSTGDLVHQQHSSRSRRLAALAVTTTAALAFTAFGSTPAFAEDAVAAAATHTIAQIQGTGAASPLPNNTAVTVDAIVTADHRLGGFGG